MITQFSLDALDLEIWGGQKLVNFSDTLLLTMNSDQSRRVIFDSQYSRAALIFQENEHSCPSLGLTSPCRMTFAMSWKSSWKTSIQRTASIAYCLMFRIPLLQSEPLSYACINSWQSVMSEHNGIQSDSSPADFMLDSRSLNPLSYPAHESVFVEFPCSHAFSHGFCTLNAFSYCGTRSIKSGGDRLFSTEATYGSLSFWIWSSRASLISVLFNDL
jgi:hypothetical protein